MGVKLNPFTGKLDVVDSPSGDFNELELNAGTASEPSIAFAGDPDTGIYSPGANQVAISTNGTGALFIDENGRVGIGAAPDGQLSLLGANSNTPRLRIQHPSNDKDAAISTYFDGSGTYLLTGSNHYLSSTGSNTKFDATSGSSAWYLDGSGLGIFYNSSGSGSISERLRITSDGKLGLGTSSPSNIIDIQQSLSGGTVIASLQNTSNTASSNTRFKIVTGGSSGGNPILQFTDGTYNWYINADQSDSNKLKIGTSISDSKFVMTTGGNVGIGTTNPGYKLQVANETTAQWSSGLSLAGSTNLSIVAAALNNPDTTITGPETFFNIQAGGSGAAIHSIGVKRTGSGTGDLIFRRNVSGGSAESLRVDTSGRLLVGTSNSSNNSLLQIKANAGSTTSYAYLSLQRGSAPGTNDDLAYIDFTDSSGNPGAWIQARRDGGTWTGGSSHPTFLAFSTTADSASSPTERWRIDSQGTLRGVSNASIVAPAVYLTTTANAANINVSATGLFARSTSSLKYKENVQNATHGLTELLQLRPVTYTGKTEADGSKVFGGLIAEEVDAVGLSEFVQYSEDGSPDALAYGNMVSLCVKAIQEQQAVIEELKAKVAALEAS